MLDDVLELLEVERLVSVSDENELDEDVPEVIELEVELSEVTEVAELSLDVLRLDSLDVLRLVIVEAVDTDESELVDRLDWLVSLVAVESEDVLRLDSLESDEGVFDDSLVAVERLELDVEDEDIIISRCLNC